MSLERWDWAKLRKEVESRKEPRPEAVTKKRQASRGRQERGDEQEINAMKAMLHQVEKISQQDFLNPVIPRKPVNI